MIQAIYLIDIIQGLKLMIIGPLADNTHRHQENRLRLQDLAYDNFDKLNLSLLLF